MQKTGKERPQTEYIKNCGDCGRFVEKEDWVPKDHSWKKYPLCGECASHYGPYEYGHE